MQKLCADSLCKAFLWYMMLLTFSQILANVDILENPCIIDVYKLFMLDVL
jgi:hypothetical protein